MTVPLKTGNILLRLMSPAACNIFCFLSIEEDDFCFSNSCCLLNQNTAYVVTANHNCHHFLFISMGVNCYTFTCYNYVQLTKGLRQLRKCKKTYKPVWALL